MRRLVGTICLLIVSLLGCQNNTCRSQEHERYHYRSPEQGDDGLQVSSLEEAGVDTLQIERAVQKIRKGSFGEIHALLLYRNGALVLEEYFPGHDFQWDAPGAHGAWVQWNESEPHSIQSRTKSITSACIGIAVAKGLINNTEQSIFDYLPEHQHLAKDGKEKITIAHLLTMTSGLDWNEWDTPYGSVENPIVGIWFSNKDPVSFILERDLQHQPGTDFTYDSGHQLLLGEILRNASGMGIDTFSEKHLFSPLGISKADWGMRFPNGVIQAAGGLRMRPRDMLKIGITFLNDGAWKGTQVVPEEWVALSRTPYRDNTSIRVPGERSEYGYAYSWWTRKMRTGDTVINAFWALGRGGQRIYILPELDAVAVFTAGDYDARDRTMKMLKKHIVPAME